MGEWWQFKIAPALAVSYATAILTGVSIFSLWRVLLALLLALGSGAAFVSILNDACDRADDAMAAKPNRLAGRSPVFITVALAIPAGLGMAIGCAWLGDSALLTAYCGAWIAFAAYSLPPLRLKARGLAGLFADAAGAHLFPALMAALVVLNGAGRSDPAWISAIGCWSFAYGLRGIMWHQLSDAEADRAAGVQSFVVATSPQAVKRLARYLVFPVECAALGVVIWRLDEPFLFLTLIGYALLVAGKMAYLGMRPVVVGIRENYFILMGEYYIVILPLSLLSIAVVRHGADVVVAGIDIALFAVAIVPSIKGAKRVVLGCCSEIRYRLLHR
nr:UbiA family prenyltransferase [Sphingomonas sp. CROZ-RG-20F-R02-07]